MEPCIELRADVFNVFNTVNFNNPNTQTDKSNSSRRSFALGRRIFS